MLKCRTCGKKFATEYDLEVHEARHLSQTHRCPWPGCRYHSKMRGPLKLHWKGHLVRLAQQRPTYLQKRQCSLVLADCSPVLLLALLFVVPSAKLNGNWTCHQGS